MIAFMKKVFSKSHTNRKTSSGSLSRQQLKAEVKKGAEEAVKRYRGVFEKLAEYDRA